MLSTLVENLIKLYHKNLVCVLQYGSSLKTEQSTDIDLIVVLKNKKNPRNDYVILKEIKSLFPEFILDLQVKYEEEFFSGDYFSIDSHGNYFLDVIKNAKVLYGKNPANNLHLDLFPKLSSIYNQIQLYVFRARQECIGMERLSKDKNKNFHRKKIINILKDLLFFEGDFFFDHVNEIEDFIKKFPKVLSNEDLALLKGKQVIDIDESIIIYEKLMTLAVKLSLSARIKIKPKRVSIDGMIMEYHLCQGGKAIILLDGLPSVPHQKEVMTRFSRLGYSVFFPRYKGTWESKGNFLEKTPAFEIDQLIYSLKKGITLDGKKEIFKEINILSTSFGGAVALCLENKKLIHKCICLSPVYSFLKIEEMNSIGKYLEEYFSGSYRFSSDNWRNLTSGKILNPSSFKKKYSSKYLMIGGEDDKTINFEDLKKFSVLKNIKVAKIATKGHLNFSDLKDNFFDIVIEFLTNDV